MPYPGAFVALINETQKLVGIRRRGALILWQTSFRPVSTPRKPEERLATFNADGKAVPHYHHDHGPARCCGSHRHRSSPDRRIAVKSGETAIYQTSAIAQRRYFLANQRQRRQCCGDSPTCARASSRRSEFGGISSNGDSLASGQWAPADWWRRHPGENFTGDGVFVTRRWRRNTAALEAAQRRSDTAAKSAWQLGGRNSMQTVTLDGGAGRRRRLCSRCWSSGTRPFISPEVAKYSLKTRHAHTEHPRRAKRYQRHRL